MYLVRDLVTVILKYIVPIHYILHLSTEFFYQIALFGGQLQAMA